MALLLYLMGCNSRKPIRYICLSICCMFVSRQLYCRLLSSLYSADCQSVLPLSFNPESNSSSAVYPFLLILSGFLYFILLSLLFVPCSLFFLPLQGNLIARFLNLILILNLNLLTPLACQLGD